MSKDAHRKGIPIIFVFLMSYAVISGEECSADNVNKCYECSSNSFQEDNWCGDPFNFSHPEVRLVDCYEACGKWVGKPRSGGEYFIRTCSTNLELNMPVAYVCMKESRPGDGHLCFCKKSRCNDSFRLKSTLAFWQLIIFEFFILTLTCVIMNFNCFDTINNHKLENRCLLKNYQKHVDTFTKAIIFCPTEVSSINNENVKTIDADERDWEPG